MHSQRCIPPAASNLMPAASNLMPAACMLSLVKDVNSCLIWSLTRTPAQGWLRYSNF